MTYVIAMPMTGGSYFLTSVRKGGLTYDGRYVGDCERAGAWMARRFKTRGAADKALHLLETVGGFDRFEVRESATI